MDERSTEDGEDDTDADDSEDDGSEGEGSADDDCCVGDEADYYDGAGEEGGNSAPIPRQQLERTSSSEEISSPS